MHPQPTSPQGQSTDVIPSGTYVADPERSQLTFRAKAFGLVWVRGSMPVTSGTVEVTSGQLRGAGDVSATGVTTGLRVRDWHLRTKHYLHTSTHPKIRLVVEGADLTSGKAAARVSVRGNSAPLELILDSAELRDGTVRLAAHGTIDRSSLGMLPPVCGVSRLVHVAVVVVATQATAP
jgi:polyisoprenoid-binding protein YceI